MVGDNVMWTGMSPDDGKTWTNVFAGKISGDTISGTWADVPRGKFGGLGTLTLKVSQMGAKIVMQKIGSTGSGFGTSNWEKPSCPIMAESFQLCGWATNLDEERRPPGGPPLQPPPEFGK